MILSSYFYPFLSAALEEWQLRETKSSLRIDYIVDCKLC